MNEISDSFRRLVPDGVRYLPLREVGTWYGGGTPSKSVSEYWENGTVPWLSPKDMDVDRVLDTEDHITERALEASPAKLVPAGAVAFVVRSNILRRRFPIALVSVAVALNQDMRAVLPHSGILSEYLAHVCRARSETILTLAGRTDGSMAAIQSSALMEYRVPVPPVEIQREIVRILDSFVALEVEIERELEARQRQRHAFVRTLSDAAKSSATGLAAEYVRLGEVATQHVEPVSVQPNDTYVNLGVKWYGAGVFARESKPGSSIKGSTLYGVKAGQLIYNRMFVIEGSFAVVKPELAHGVVSNEFPAYDLDSSRVLPEWLLLYLRDEYTLKRISAEVTGVERGSTKSRRRWKENQFEAFQIELPSLLLQRKLLRANDAVAGIESALRDEQLARRLQHEYYRDRLLTFEELAV